MAARAVALIAGLALAALLLGPLGAVLLRAEGLASLRPGVVSSETPVSNMKRPSSSRATPMLSASSRVRNR